MLAKPVSRYYLKNDYLTKLQYGIFNDLTRFRVLTCGRRFGKTYEDVEELLKFATVPLNKIWGPAFQHNTGYKQNVWYVAPTYRMAKDIAWEVLKDRLDNLGWAYKPNETFLSVYFPFCKSTISLKGADNYNSLRGRGLNFVVLDEFADIAKEAWTEVLRPALSDKMGHALFTGTPKGFNWAYDLHCYGVDKKKGWRSWQYTTLDGGFVTEEEIEDAKNDLDERTFRQEYLASFETYAGAVYYNFHRVESVRPHEPFTGTAIHVGMDFNIDPMTAVVADIENKEVKEGLVMPVVTFKDLIMIYGSNTYEMCDEIKYRYPDKRVYVYPDPACTQRKTSAPGGVTDLSILKKAGFIVRVRSSHSFVRDRINAVNSKLKNYNGIRSLFVSDCKNCKPLITSLERQKYKEGTSVPDKGEGYDHRNDAVGYLIDYLFPVNERKTSIVEV